MRKNNILLGAVLKIIRIFDELAPDLAVDFRINMFRFISDLFFHQSILNSKVQNFKDEKDSIFFGYYDITPFSYNNEKILAIRSPELLTSPTINNHADVGFFNISKPDCFIKLSKTNAWCWQQGCRLQWIGDRGKKIIFNCTENNSYIAKIIEIKSGKVEKKIKRAIYSISGNGKWGLSLDFSRLQRLRPGYGYGVLRDKTIGVSCPKNSGIELIDLSTNKVTLLFSIYRIATINPHKSMDQAEHYFNHIMFNPSGDKFLFLHLWNKNNKRHSRLFVANRNGDDIKLINNSGIVSHYNWISDDDILLYSLVEEREALMYAIFSSVDNKIKYFKSNIPKKDGHPTLLKGDKDIMLTDNYPGLCSRRSVLLYQIKKDKVEVLARFDSPRTFSGEFRCDLHPRISNDEKKICVDRVINGKRCISVMPIKSA